MHMIDLAATEVKTSMEMDDRLTERLPTSIKVYPSDRKIVLHYGPDGEKCYYKLKGYMTYTAFIYGNNKEEVEDFKTFDDQKDAIQFAKRRNYDEVVNDVTGEVVWEK